MIRNKDQRSRDYSEIAGYYRPGHADYNYDQKYGFRDYRGGGRSSGRETIGRVAAGAIASKLLAQLGITFSTYTLSIGPVAIDKDHFEETAIWENPFYMPDKDAAQRTEEYLKTCMKDHNSSGGMIECIIKNVPGGLGDPAFEKLDANLGKAIFSIGAVKGVEIGERTSGVKGNGASPTMTLRLRYKRQCEKLSNHAGGITGGISDGCNTDIILRAAIKPTPSIAAPQKTVNRDGENIEISIKGRHDPVIVPRAVVVVESMAALVIADALLGSMTSRMDKIIKFFR